MQIAILHYHLNAGGVTQVIANHLRSLDLASDKDAGHKIAIFHGGDTNDWNAPFLNQVQNVEVSVYSIPSLSYDRWPLESLDPDNLANILIRRLAELDFDPVRTVIHVHNHSLGKNLSLPGAIHRLVAAGYPLLLQIHDFAEDFRPEQYRRLTAALSTEQSAVFAGLMYPQASRIHYAVLNGRDCEILGRSGVPADRLHTLPNPIVEFGELPSRDKVRHILKRDNGVPIDKPLVVYPARCIRRKNVGELLLWAAIFRDQMFFAATLPPLNDAEKPAYDRWNNLAKEANLPCAFELGNQLSFQESLAAADALITTSVAEGFGMVFLESQLVGLRLIGRKLPEITDEFEKNDIDLSALYERLVIPIDLIGIDRLREAIIGEYYKTIENFDHFHSRESDVAVRFDRLLAKGVIDFAILTPDIQSELILYLSKSCNAHDDLFAKNPHLEASLHVSPEDQSLVQNARAVREHYGPASCGKQLQNIYHSLLKSEPEASIRSLERSDQILDSFLSIDRFRPVRSLS